MVISNLLQVENKNILTKSFVRTAIKESIYLENIPNKKKENFAGVVAISILMIAYLDILQRVSCI